MTILVTGATGGLGTFFTQWLKNNKNELIVTTGRAPKTDENYLVCDLMNTHQLQQLIVNASPRLIYHLAASFTDNMDIDFNINYKVASYIIETIRKDMNDTRLVLIGTAAEYGHVSPSDNPIEENHRLNPISIYGLTKTFQTQLGIFNALKSNLNVVIARIFNLEMPGLSDRLFVGRLEKLIKSYKKKEIKKIPLGNLSSIRDYTNADNCASLLNLIGEKGKSGEIYHIASGNPICMRDLLTKILHKEGLDLSIIEEGKYTHPNNNLEVPIIYANMTKTFSLYNENK